MKIIKNILVEGKHKKPIVTDVFYKETHQPKKIIIFCHGYKGFKDWGAWNLMATAFASAGFFFIKFNFSYNGGTPKQPIDFPDLEAFGNNNYTKELDDLESILDWISTNTDFKKEANSHCISIIGHSRGGGIVTIKTAEDSRIKNLISLASVCDFGSRSSTIGDLENWKKTGVKYVLNGRTKQLMPHFYQFYTNFKENEERLNIKKSAQKIKVPHLIIHGDSDASISVEEGKKIHSWNPKSTLKIIKNADHVFNVSHPWKKDKMSKELAAVTKICIDFITKS
ncbi:alpha/beta fold hydrolase [Polaribacter batillariae]|uniref:Alpha/beta fold hydrolase n=1 Tax=Polaribacter batillariae TaxID=2808900 RepID=A0ABX7SQD8_9FLAO|nr:alpha/beta fold hydrolase [Polaribacter batillariae]QTD36444.1 alpha/beta fold hydrolase [Polaribacter batillariae]